MRSFKTAFRLVSLLLYGFSLLLFYHAQPIAAKAYNDLCSSQGITFHEPESATFLIVVLVIGALPLLLSRSNAMVLTNLILGVITIFGAGLLLSTAANTPYECFTQAGTYEDRTSGLDGFEMWFGFAIVLSYIFTVIDLAIWSVRKVFASRGHVANGANPI
jgi:hypothetical protein